MPIKRRLQRPITALAVTAAAALAITGCASGGTAPTTEPTAAPETGGSFTVAVYGDALNLDPQNCVPVVFCYVAYDALTTLSPEGEVLPGLATEWEWVDDTHTKLRFTLRDATFTDGTPLTGEAVAASITSYLNTPGPFAALSYPIVGAEEVDETHVDVTFAEPLTDHYAAFLFSGQSSVGRIVSPAAAADRSIMLGETAGIGPYVYDAAASTQGVRYVYVPNEDYYAPESIAFDEVILEPMMDPTARVNAIRAGQVDWATNVPSADLATLESAGLTISTGPLGSLAVLALQARDSGPLADVRVRQALAYATPRADIAGAFFGEAAVPTSSMIGEGAEGYNADAANAFDYDPEKAKALLAEAGYADGLTISVFDPAFFDPGSRIGQALKAAYEEVGVTIDLVPSDAPPGQVAMESGQYDAIIMSNGGNGLSAAIYTMFRPMGLANPRGVPLDAEFAALLLEAATADSAEQAALMTEATGVFTQLVYAVPIALNPTLQAVNPEIKGVPAIDMTLLVDPFSAVPGEAWHR